MRLMESCTPLAPLCGTLVIRTMVVLLKMEAKGLSILNRICLTISSFLGLFGFAGDCGWLIAALFEISLSKMDIVISVGSLKCRFL